MKTITLSLFLILLLVGCQNSNQSFSKEDTQLLLQEITKNIEIEPSEYFDSNNPGSTNLLIVTRYPLSEKQLMEYNKFGYIKTNTEDIADSVAYKVKNHKLINQDAIEVQFVDNNKTNYLQKYALIKDEGIVYQDLGFELTINSIFTKLDGFVTIEFSMPNNMTKEVKIPVSI